MTWRFLPQVYVLFVGAFLSAGAAFIAWRRRKSPGGLFLCLALAAMSEWALAGGLEAAVVEQPAKIFWSQVCYVGFVNIPPLMLLFVLHAADKDIQSAYRDYFMADAVITLVLVWTNAWHGLVWKQLQPWLGRGEHPGVPPWRMVLCVYSLLLPGFHIARLAKERQLRISLTFRVKADDLSQYFIKLKLKSRPFTHIG